MAPTELTLRLQPRARYDVIDVRREARRQHGGALDAYPRGLYCSYHTTAGFLEQSLCARLGYDRQFVDPFMQMFQRVFPEAAEHARSGEANARDWVERFRRVADMVAVAVPAEGG